MDDFWKKEKIVGYAPRRQITCPRCKETMVLRHSACRGVAIFLAYKCPECDRFIRFAPFQGNDKKYIKEVFDDRGGFRLFIPSEEWLENEKIKQKLESLGYW